MANGWIRVFRNGQWPPSLVSAFSPIHCRSLDKMAKFATFNKRSPRKVLKTLKTISADWKTLEEKGSSIIFSWILNGSVWKKCQTNQWSVLCQTVFDHPIQYGEKVQIHNLLAASHTIVARSVHIRTIVNTRFVHIIMKRFEPTNLKKVIFWGAAFFATKNIWFSYLSTFTH